MVNSVSATTFRVIASTGRSATVTENASAVDVSAKPNGTIHVRVYMNLISHKSLCAFL